MADLRRIGTLGLIALVALRVGIGWHFFKEGADKIRSGTFSSEGFLKSAEGRFAGLFHGLVWDSDGSIRLNKDLTTEFFQNGAEQAKKHFGLAAEQAAKVDASTKSFVAKLNEIYAEHREAIYKYDESLRRVQKMNEASFWSQVRGLRDQKRKIEKERIQEVAPAIASIEAVSKQFESRLNELGAQGKTTAKRFHLSRPGENSFSSSTLDRIIPIFDLTIGVLLIIGLFVPLAGWLGALFLAGVVFSQFPGDPNTQATYFQSVEALALVVLATVGAGRFAGLDFFPWAFRQNKKAKALQATPPQK